MNTLSMARKKKDKTPNQQLAQAIIDQYQPQSVEDMQNALKDIFDPMFEAMLQELVVGIAHRFIKIGKDFMKCFVFTAGIYRPGINQRGKKFKQIISKIVCQFKIIHIFFELHFFKDYFSREIS